MENIKGKTFYNYEISYGNSKTGLVGSNYFWEFPSIPKRSEPFETFIDSLSVFIVYAELKVYILDMLVSFDEVILLELQCMVGSMAAHDLFCRLQMDALIFYSYY